MTAEMPTILGQSDSDLRMTTLPLSAPVGDVGEGGCGFLIQWVVSLQREQKSVL